MGDEPLLEMLGAIADELERIVDALETISCKMSTMDGTDVADLLSESLLDKHGNGLATMVGDVSSSICCAGY